MAHQVIKRNPKQKCPRCGCGEATLAEFHFGSTWTAECSECSYGRVRNANSIDNALSRLNGNYYEKLNVKKGSDDGN